MVLGGLMGAGKSSVAPLLGVRLGLPAFDLDADLVTRHGASIPELFARHGEAAFREMEQRAFAERLAGPPSVVAAGGGTLCQAAAWETVGASGAITVVLTADPAVLAERTQGPGRPLLEGAEGEARAARLADLAAVRDPWYRRAELQVVTGGRDLAEVADAVADAVRARAARTVPFRLGAHGYRLEVEAGGLDDLGAAMARRLPPTGPRAVVGLVSDGTVAGLHGAAAAASLTRAGYRVVPVTFPAGEAHKHLGTVASILDALLEGGLQRGSPVVALGGGVVGDVAGFAASILYRGTPVVQVPTTLLAMVDAALGGKTAVDHRMGKNLIGSFHQPALVHAALGTLATLPDRAYRAALGEVVKYALLQPGWALLEALEAGADAILDRDPARLQALVVTCASLKARVVEADETEAGARRLLNLGHTLGHALETHSGYGTWLHGEAVALGLLAAVRVGMALGLTPPALLERLQKLLTRLTLPADDAPLRDPAVVARVAYDKKYAGDAVRFVVPVDGGGARVVPLDLPTLQSMFTGTGDGT